MLKLRSKTPFPRVENEPILKLRDSPFSIRQRELNIILNSYLFAWLSFRGIHWQLAPSKRSKVVWVKSDVHEEVEEGGELMMTAIEFREN